jgi:hypothetical protein
LRRQLLLKNEIPVEILFKPTTYGKAMHGVLIIDTFDVQYVIELQGTLPVYFLPLILHSGMIDTPLPESA